MLTPRIIKSRHGLLQLMQACLCDTGFLTGLVEFILQADQAGFIRCTQAAVLEAQPLAPRAKLARLLLNPALLCGQHLNLLLHFGNAGSLCVGRLLRQPLGVLQAGQLIGLFLRLNRQYLCFFFSDKRQTGQILDLEQRLALAPRPVGGLLPERGQALHNALPTLHDKTDFSLQSPDLSTGFVQMPLRLVDMVAGVVMSLPHRLQLRLDMTQIGQARLQRIDSPLRISRHFGLLGL